MSFSTRLSSFFLMTPRSPGSTLFPYTTLFRSLSGRVLGRALLRLVGGAPGAPAHLDARCDRRRSRSERSEEHTSELQSRFDLVCRLLLEKKKHDRTTVTFP